MLRERIRELWWAGVCMRRLGSAASGSVLLTFDDGPHPRITPAVLDRLAEHGARGVFFIVGRRIARAPELLRRIVGAGHIIGNHSFQHERARCVGLRAYCRDLCRCQTAVIEQTGRAPVLFRPPFGEVSATTVLAARWHGLRPVAWSLDSEDWQYRTPEDAPRTVERVLANVRARDVILLHDDHLGVLAILDRLLPSLKERGLDLARGAAWLAGDGLQAQAA
jgi:peptidoglycan/xylan/chitin deacetylase (PgdA/CDA1 family)